eukprot:2920202-Rhodomonas_salina.4
MIQCQCQAAPDAENQLTGKLPLQSQAAPASPAQASLASFNFWCRSLTLIVVVLVLVLLVVLVQWYGCCQCWDRSTRSQDTGTGYSGTG